MCLKLVKDKLIYYGVVLLMRYLEAKKQPYRFVPFYELLDKDRCPASDSSAELILTFIPLISKKGTSDLTELKNLAQGVLVVNLVGQYTKYSELINEEIRIINLVLFISESLLFHKLPLLEKVLRNKELLTQYFVAELTDERDYISSSKKA